MRVIIIGNWAAYVGTDYCDALGVYPSLEAAQADAGEYAWERWEGDASEDSDWSDEGPNFYIEEYAPDKHDMLRAGGDTFTSDFEKLEMV